MPGDEEQESSDDEYVREGVGVLFWVRVVLFWVRVVLFWVREVLFWVREGDDDDDVGKSSFGGVGGDVGVGDDG